MQQEHTLIGSAEAVVSKNVPCIRNVFFNRAHAGPQIRSNMAWSCLEQKR